MVATPNKSKDKKKKKEKKEKDGGGGGGGGEHKDDEQKSALRPPTIDCPKSVMNEGKGEGDKGLPNCVTFFPEVITYQPENKKQVRNLEVKNKGDRSIMYKMKSTSPGVYRMRPIHFLLRPGESKIVKLSYKGCPEGKSPNLKDRFTVVMAYPPGSDPNIKIMWTQKAYVEKLADCMHRKYIKVHFDGYDVPDKKEKSKMAPAPGPPPPAAAPAAPPAAPAAASPQPQPGMPGWPGMAGMPGGGGIVYVIYQGDQQGQKPGGAPPEGGEDEKDEKEGEEEEEEEEDEKEEDKEKDKDKKKK